MVVLTKFKFICTRNTIHGKRIVSNEIVFIFELSVCVCVFTKLIATTILHWVWIGKTIRSRTADPNPCCSLKNENGFFYLPAVTLTTGTSHLPPVNPGGQLHMAIDRPTCLKKNHVFQYFFIMLVTCWWHNTNEYSYTACLK